MLNKLILFALSLFFLPACFNFGGGLSVRHNYPSVGEGSAPSDSSYLYVDLDTNQYESAGALVPYYEISTTTEFGDAERRDSLSNCEIYHDSIDEEEDEIEKKSASEDNLICILDIMEYDFMVNEIHINYNFPEGMCDYINWSLPWHFNHEILPGPVVVQKTTEVPADPLPQICSENPNDDSCTVEKTTLCDTSVTPENCQDTSDNFSEEDFCPASDGSDENPVRCCSGGSKVDGTEWEPDLGCFGGPALIADTGNTKEFHESVLEELPEGGLKGSFTLPDLVSINGAEQRGNAETGLTSVSSPFANYLKDLDRSSEKLNQVKRADLPDFLKISPYYDYWPEPFFRFECLDRAGEILHVILLMIREWNTYAEFIDFYNDGGNDSADPDVEGSEGDDCDYEDRRILGGEVQACNDLLDLDDIKTCEDYVWCSEFSQASKIPGKSDTNVIYPRIEYNTGGGE